MKIEYQVKYLRDPYGNLTRLTPMKVILDDSDSVIAEMEVSALEFATSKTEEAVLHAITEAKAVIKLELDRMLAYDPMSELPTKGVSSPQYGFTLGSCVAAILDIAAYSASASR